MSKHVLIAEDDTVLADMMSKVLAKKNVRVSIALNGAEAIAALETDTPDLLLLDVLMPGIDGYAVMQTIKERALSCPVIVVSNLSDSVTKARCKNMNVAHYFVKTDLDDEDLWPSIEKFLR